MHTCTILLFTGHGSIGVAIASEKTAAAKLFAVSLANLQK